MTKDTTEVAAFLARIEKLPGEWHHPQVTVPAQLDPNFYMDIALDLHLRHIAEKLAYCEIGIWPDFDSGKWWVDDTERLCRMLAADTYALALLSAAEAIVGEGK